MSLSDECARKDNLTKECDVVAQSLKIGVFRHNPHACDYSVKDLIEASASERVSALKKRTRPPTIDRVHSHIGILIDYLAHGHEWRPLLQLELHQIVPAFGSRRRRYSVPINRKMQGAGNGRSDVKIYDRRRVVAALEIAQSDAGHKQEPFLAV